MPNGDIVSGCSDSIIRVFSESEDRWASAEDLKTFDDQVTNDVKKTDVPGLESLTEPGPWIFKECEPSINPTFQVKRTARSRQLGMGTPSRLTRYVGYFILNMP